MIAAKRIALSAILFSLTMFSLALIPQTARGQQPLQGQVSSDSSQTDFYNVYANSDPLGGAPEETPTTIGPNESNKCIPPNPAWQLVAQQENNCYWYAPFAHPLNGYVVPMTKMSWVEETGGTCSVNPFSNPESPNATAVCNQPAPQNNPYGPPPPISSPGAPTDYYSNNPNDPTQLLANYKDIITKAGRGNPRQLSAQLGPQLGQDMKSCEKYSAKGILSPACCTNLGQAANFNLESTAGGYQQSKMYQQGAAMACGLLVASNPDPSNTLPDAPEDPPKYKCRETSALEVTCYPSNGGPPVVLKKQIPRTDPRTPLHGGANKNQPNDPPLQPPQVPRMDPGRGPLQGGANSNQPRDPLSGNTYATKRVGCAHVRNVGGASQDITITIESGAVVSAAKAVGTWKVIDPPGIFTQAIGADLPDGSYIVTGLYGPRVGTFRNLSIPVDFSGGCR